MTKVVVTLLVAALFCYAAEASTQEDLQSSISRVGYQEKGSALRRAAHAFRLTFTPTLTRQQGACLIGQLKSTYPTINQAILETQAALRSEAPTWADEDLAPLTPAQLDEKVRARFQEPVDSAVANIQAGINTCLQ